MVRFTTAATLLALFVFGASSAVAQSEETFTQNGIEYVRGSDGVTYQVVPRVMNETVYQNHQWTGYREQYKTDIQETPRTYYVPVTEYQWVGAWERGWNPFATPRYAYRLVPSTRWETRADVVRTPVTRRELIPEQRTTQVPVTTQKLVKDRIAVGTTNGGTSIANSNAIGGIQKIDTTAPR